MKLGLNVVLSTTDLWIRFPQGDGIAIGVYPYASVATCYNSFVLLQINVQPYLLPSDRYRYAESRPLALKQVKHIWSQDLYDNHGTR